MNGRCWLCGKHGSGLTTRLGPIPMTPGRLAHEDCARRAYDKIRADVDAAPPLTAEQRESLALIFGSRRRARRAAPGGDHREAR